MRVLRAVLAPAAGLAAGLLVAFGAAAWLRAAVPATGLLWNVVGVSTVASWLVAMAHGVPLDLSMTAGLTAPEAGGVERVGELLGGGAEATFGFSILVIPVALLVVVGVTTALVVRLLAPRTSRELGLLVAGSAVVHGAGLAAVGLWGRVDLAFSGTLAAQLGLGGAQGRIALTLGPSVLLAGVVGLVWGAAFGAAGGLASPRMRVLLETQTRVVMRGWLRGLGAVSGVIAVLVVVGGIGAVASGKGPGPGALGLGMWLLWANAVAGVLLVSHGVPIQVALDAGPFTGWEQVALWGFGIGGGRAPAASWVVVALPIVAGVVAGRFAARRTTLDGWRIATAIGGLWALTLAVLALLLRARVLSSFSVGDISLGGGTAAADPLVALLLGFGWGTATAFAGVWSIRRTGAAAPIAVG